MRLLYVIIGCVAILWGCSQRNREAQREVHDPHQHIDREKLIEANRKYLKAETNAIERYVTERQWDYRVHKNGVYYRILTRSGNNEKAKEGDVVYFTCEMELLNGKRIYEDEPALRTLRIDREDAEIGLHEMLKLFSPGDSVQMVLPSFLAFGLAGDLDEVGMRQPVVYSIKIEKIAKQ
ncbi:FKBP-type peptidyl-prolyl cis-trans isomerase [Schleiferia thermophila]|uniref:FKBP-type peptidyl-prolyl cis-trans isomerase n=1 Tax=Schleiferia thermophila TaxID=884107 RepID=UPI003EEC8225